MEKFRITITTVIEYTPDITNYPEVTTIEEMAAIDLESAKDDPILFLGMPCAETEVTMSIIKDEK